MDCNDNTLPLFGLPKYSMLQSVWIKNSTGITKSGVTRELHPYQSCFPWLIAANDFKSFSHSNCKPTFGEHTLASPVGIAAPWYNIQEQVVNNTIVLFYFYFIFFIFISNSHDHLFNTHPDTKPPACDIGQQHLSTFLIGTGACFLFFSLYLLSYGYLVWYRCFRNCRCRVNLFFFFFCLGMVILPVWVQCCWMPKQRGVAFRFL